MPSQQSTAQPGYQKAMYNGGSSNHSHPRMSVQSSSDKPVPPTPRIASSNPHQSSGPEHNPSAPAMHPDMDQRKDQWVARVDDTASSVYQPHSNPRQMFLRVRIHTIDKAKKDLLVRFDAQTNLPHFRASSYPGITRSYRELCLFALALSLSSPAIIVPALPLPSTTASGLQDTRILRLMLARWFSRILAEPSLRDHPETRNLIEADFAYQPNPPGTGSSSAARKRFANAMASAASVAYGGVDTTGGLPNGVLATSASAGSRISGGGFGILGLGASSKGLSTSRSVYDDDEDLVAARAEVTRLEMQFADAAEASEKLAHSRRSLTVALSDLSIKLCNLGSVEEIRPPSLRLGLPYVLKRTAYTARSLGELQDAISNTELLTIGDAVAYQSINARAAKEAMLARNALVEEHHNAQKATVNKKRELEHLRTQRNLRADRVDDALEELEDAKRHEQALAQNLRKISQTLHNSLQNHSRHAHQDLQQAMLEHARGSVMFSRQLLKEMKALKSELENTKRPEAAVGGVGTPIRPSHGLTPALGSVPPPFAHVNSDVGSPGERCSSAHSRPDGLPFTGQSDVRSNQAPPPPLFRHESMVRSNSATSSPSTLERANTQPPHSPMPTTPNAWAGPSPLGTPNLSQSMYSADLMSRTNTQDNPFAGPTAGAQSMFLDRPTGAVRPNAYGTLNSGSSGTASGRSRISASEAARSLAGKF
ncbi:related to VPS17 - vacuolar protein sorting-associated protein [Melanopsichium pennsylvanicum]|uniref:Related to VPS17 - vacuolar protein sorting-associated protein n=2 Tax=Melanopsichium pennsylvanicum TaxID=63383 RepID=A0AAJ4XIJ4_9BASI|nr:related to VPS17-vacuolar protein sorting-associated protein [Melanopsichium pennsylvanicum 4]SNX82780.1 related to VPS17 - vacuolar protein sorting-associated protein [Melanopsichium pennsylvanicum]